MLFHLIVIVFDHITNVISLIVFDHITNVISSNCV